METSVEFLRIGATFLLVSYHVINAPVMKARLDPAHPLQVFSDFFIDLRMPLFAFIAGLVYAMRPIGTGRFPAFVGGKARRLLVPGAIAALAFAAAASAMGNRFAVPLGEAWRLLVFPYAHFWFLQAIFLILILVAGSEKLFGRWAVPVLFAVSSAALIAGLMPAIDLFSLRGATYLLPYMTLGILAWRHRDALDRYRFVVMAVAAALFAAGALWNVHHFIADGAFSDDRRDLQSWSLAAGACLLLLIFPVRIPALATFGAFSFTIYLYHVFGTSGARQLLSFADVANVWVHFAAGVAAGFCLPVLLHLAAMRLPLARRLVLGLR